MAIGTGAAVWQTDAAVTATTSASALATAAIDAESKTAVVNAAPLCDVVLTCTFATAPAAAQVVLLYRRDLNIDGTSDAPIPDSNFKSLLVGHFIVDAVTTSQLLIASSVPLSPDCEFYIENQAGQTMSSGWTLKVSPKSYNAKA